MVEAIFSKILIDVCHRSIKNTGQSATEMFRILQEKHEIVEEIEDVITLPSCARRSGHRRHLPWRR